MTEDERKARIAKDLADHGLDMKPVSLAAGLNETFVRDMLKRGKKPSAENLDKIEAAIARLINRVTLDPATPEVRPAGVPPIYRAEMAKDVEVWGTVAAAEMIGKGAFRISSDPIDVVYRPPGLANAKDVYSLFVEGVSMSPMYDPGTLIYVSPHRPARPGDVVIIQDPIADGEDFEGYLKILVRRSSTEVVVRQLNPEGELRFKAHDALRIHRVFTNNELFGV